MYYLGAAQNYLVSHEAWFYTKPGDKVHNLEHKTIWLNYISLVF